MTGFEPRISGVGSDRSTNCTATTLPLLIPTFHSFLPKNLFWEWNVGESDESCFKAAP